MNEKIRSLKILYIFKNFPFLFFLPMLTLAFSSTMVPKVLMKRIGKLRCLYESPKHSGRVSNCYKHTNSPTN